MPHSHVTTNGRYHRSKVLFSSQMIKPVHRFPRQKGRVYINVKDYPFHPIINSSFRYYIEHLFFFQQIFVGNRLSNLILTVLYQRFSIKKGPFRSFFLSDYRACCCWNSAIRFFFSALVRCLIAYSRRMDSSFVWNCS